MKHDVLEDKIREIKEGQEMKDKIQVMVKDKRSKSLVGFMEMEIPF